MTTILVVDDNAEIRVLLRRLLTRAGFKVEEGTGGVDAFGKMLTSTIDLVVVDYNMPTMNGLEFVAYVRKDPSLAKVPILILSSDGELHLVEAAKKAGAQGWIVKSYDAKGLVQAIRAILRLPEP